MNNIDEACAKVVESVLQIPATLIDKEKSLADMSCDSLDLLQMVIEFEEELGIDLDEREFTSNFLTQKYSQAVEELKAKIKE